MKYAYNLVNHKLSYATIATFLLLSVTFVITTAISYQCSHQEKRSWRGFWRHCLPPQTFHHPSARADFWFYVSGKLMGLGALTNISVAISVGVLFNRLLRYAVPWLPATTVGSASLLIVFTLTMLITNDFARFLSHYLQHRIPVLWELHKTHHSAEVMSILTTHRAHPLELLIAAVFEGVLEGVVYGVWLFYAYDPVEVAIFGIGVYRFASIVTLDYIKHAPYKVSFGPPLSLIFLPPDYHHLHHSASPQHWNKNYGVALSCWDRLFGTLMVPKRDEIFTFGLRIGDQESEEYHSWWRLYVVPLVKIGRMTSDWVAATSQRRRLHLIDRTQNTNPKVIGTVAPLQQPAP